MPVKSKLQREQKSIELDSELSEEIPESEIFDTRDCLVELRSADSATGVEYRDCIIDYTRCTNRKCIKQLI